MNNGLMVKKKTALIRGASHVLSQFIRAQCDCLRIQIAGGQLVGWWEGGLVCWL